MSDKAMEAAARALCARDIKNRFITPEQKQELIDKNWPALVTRAQDAIAAYHAVLSPGGGEIAEIWKRHERDAARYAEIIRLNTIYKAAVEPWGTRAHRDRAALLFHIATLEGEREGLRAEIEQFKTDYWLSHDAIDSLTAHIATLEAELKSAREAQHPCNDINSPACAWMQNAINVKAALEAEVERLRTALVAARPFVKEWQDTSAGSTVLEEIDRALAPTAGEG